MTLEDKRKCSEIWEILTAEYISPGSWNPEAADALADMLDKIRKCSSAMSFVPAPSALRPSWGWVVSSVYNVLKRRYALKKGGVFQTCIYAARTSQLNVKMKLMGL